MTSIEAGVVMDLSNTIQYLIKETLNKGNRKTSLQMAQGVFTIVLVHLHHSISL